MQGHLFKYKDKDGNWIEIPILVESMYNAYVAYCTKNSIEPVPETIYYQSVGQLKKLVEDLGSSAENLNAIADSLAQGALPQNLGGLGVAIGTDDYPTLQDALVKLANVVTIKQLDDEAAALQAAIKTLQTSMNTSIAGKEDAASFSKGTAAPTANTPGKYYFQHS